MANLICNYFLEKCLCLLVCERVKDHSGPPFVDQFLSPMGAVLTVP